MSCHQKRTNCPSKLLQILPFVHIYKSYILGDLEVNSLVKDSSEPANQSILGLYSDEEIVENYTMQLTDSVVFDTGNTNATTNDVTDNVMPFTDNMPYMCENNSGDVTELDEDCVNNNNNIKTTSPCTVPNPEENMEGLEPSTLEDAMEVIVEKCERVMDKPQDRADDSDMEIEKCQENLNNYEKSSECLSDPNSNNGDELISTPSALCPLPVIEASLSPTDSVVTDAAPKYTQDTSDNKTVSK